MYGKRLIVGLVSVALFALLPACDEQDREAARETAHEAKEDIKEGLREAKEDAREVLEDARDVAKDVGEAVREGVDKAREKSGPAIDKVKETTRRAVEKGKEVVSGLSESPPADDPEESLPPGDATTNGAGETPQGE